MKLAPLFVRAVALLLFIGGSLCAQENAGTPPAAAKKNGYTVTVDIKVDEKGQTGTVQLIETDDTSTGDVITKMALAMALKTELPVREKEGKPIKYTARVPFFFPIEDDEGAAAAALPLPRPKQETGYMPAYPPALRAEGVTGGAILELFVDAEGKLTRLTTLRASHPEFAAAATEAVQKWTFNPAQKDGQPVESRCRLAIVFETEENMAELKWRVAPRPALGAFMVIRPDKPIDESMFEATPAEGEAPAANTPAATKE
jgi:TonB family protein